MFTSRGVTAPVNQGTPANEGTPNTVISAAKVETVVVEYFDGEGRRRRNTLLKLGNDYYSAANSVEWTNSLTRVRPWLEAGTTAKLPIEDKEGASVQDLVDVLPAMG
jgi:hypothetical protein